MKNYVCIMAGGKGTRFWPYSRRETPKQFIDLLGTGKSLLRMTFDRFSKIVPKSRIYIMTNKDYYDLVKETLPEINPKKQIIIEMLIRNTAPAIAFAAYKIRAKDPEANLVFTPADHLIQEEDAFLTAIEKGFAYSEREGALGILGIKPTSPHTGYGYIQFDAKTNTEGFLKVKNFTEKPDRTIAESFVKSGDFLWNAGVFFWNVETIESAFDMLAPEIHELFEDIIPYYSSYREERYAKSAFQASRNISIDYAIMEKIILKKYEPYFQVAVLPCDFGWSDLGAWNALYDTRDKDENRNVRDGNVLIYKTKDCIIKAPKDKLVVLSGLDNLIVAEHGNVLLIARREDEQELKIMYKDAQEKGEEFT